MTIHFIGAGPGAADLITVRGRDLLACCPVCIYAGSLVPIELLAHCPPDARLIDSAPLTLDQLEQEYVDAQAAGFDVARLHSGDLSIYSALAEQLRRLRRRDIPYTLTPGVPAFAAAAAALGRELTVPGVTQSVVLTRMPGRASRMPQDERLDTFGSTGATLAIHLAIHAMQSIVEHSCPATAPTALWQWSCGLAGPTNGCCVERSTLSVSCSPRSRWNVRHSFSLAVRYKPKGLTKAPSIRPTMSDVSAMSFDSLPYGWPGVPSAATRTRALATLRGQYPVFPPGEVWLAGAGAGPGDPGLLALDALAGLLQADLIVHDAPVDARVLALASEGVELQFAGKRGGQPSVHGHGSH